MSMDRNLIIKKLNRLKMPGMVETFEQRLNQAMEEKWSYSSLVEMLLTDEIEKRNNKQLMLRLSKSRLNQDKTMETFDFSFNPKVQASLI
jgi:DNA replication protein DnaC